MLYRASDLIESDVDCTFCSNPFEFFNWGYLSALSFEEGTGFRLPIWDPLRGDRYLETVLTSEADSDTIECLHLDGSHILVVLDHFSAAVRLDYSNVRACSHASRLSLSLSRTFGSLLTLCLL